MRTLFLILFFNHNRGSLLLTIGHAKAHCSRAWKSREMAAAGGESDWLSVKRKRSVVLSYFSPVDKNVVRCHLCDKRVSHRSNTSNPFSHLKSTHPTANKVCKVRLVDFARLVPV